MAADDGKLHLCVLIHGLWGNPTNMAEISKQLSDKYPDRTLRILCPKTNIGNNTYDGIEVGAERVTQEFEDLMQSLADDGETVTKLSIVGYSLGGLIARYFVGILYTRGWLDRLTAVNFTTFASPHLGVRTPLVGLNNTLWNDIGARTLSVTGQQLFTVDKFRDTDRPLLEVLADRSSIFVKGLRRFKHRNLYANIVNDRSVPFWTAFFSPTDPAADLDAVTLAYEPGYSDTVLAPALARRRTEPLTYYESCVSTGRAVVTRGPLLLAAAVFLPVGGLIYAANSAYQTMLSSKRVQLHETGAGSGYRGISLMDELQHRAERAYENLNNAQHAEYISDASSDEGDAKGQPTVQTKPSDPAHKQHSLTKTTPTSDAFPTLALTPGQFGMIDSLEELNFDKYAVHIKKAQHSHAAIIYRRHGDKFDEGKVVIRHWLERFEI